MRRVPRATWEAQRAAYHARVRPWAVARVQRMSHGQKHPVYDFLFEYYSFRPAHLCRWSPGYEVILDEATINDVLWREFVPCDNGVQLLVTAFPEHRVPYLNWAVEYLATTGQREPTYSCMGLHEWAMVYQDLEVRHPYVPLRLSRRDIDSVIESQSLRCSHYDAFRFFTPPAVLRNRWQLTRAATTENDQPGCVHVTMDLYRFAYKIAPFCPSDLLADAFELAIAARELDMRASPYDLAAYGFKPICIETTDGRNEYIQAQRELYLRAQPIRDRLLGVYRGMLRERRKNSEQLLKFRSLE